MNPRILPTSEPPDHARASWSTTSHPCCSPSASTACAPGCGEPVAMRAAAEIIDELGSPPRASACSASAATRGSPVARRRDVQALHGRAPSLATGVKRMLPDAFVFSVQGDGDMVNEGLQEIIHTAARGEPSPHPAQQRRLRRDRRPHDGDHGARATDQEHARRARRREARLPVPSPTSSPSSTAPRTSGARGEQRRQRRPDAADVQPGLRAPAARARASRSSRSSPCARPDGSSRPRKPPTTSRTR